jgi:hypothetical protein
VPRYGFVCIDIFTKKGACIPINRKLAPVTADALKRVFDELGYPTSIMCDEGGEFRGEFAQLCEDEDVKMLRSRTGGRFVERLIRTLKLRIFERKKALGGIWTAYVHHVMDQYNDTMHSSIHTKPNHVSNNEYDIAVIRQAHAWMQRSAKYPVQHAALSIGDFVKIRVKQHSFYKETFNSWSDKVYKIAVVDQTTPEGVTYHLEGYRRPLLRFELKKVEDVQRVRNGELRSVLQAVQHPPPAIAAAAPLIPAPPPAIAAIAAIAIPVAPPAIAIAPAPHALAAHVAQPPAGLHAFLANSRAARAAIAEHAAAGIAPSPLLAFLQRSRQSHNPQ